MAIARAKLVDLTVTRWYHCVSRCVRQAFLIGDADKNRKEWLENRLEELGQIFAVAVGGFSLMDNHLHVLLRPDPDLARGWSDLEIVQRWGRLFPPRNKSRQPMPVNEQWIQWRLANPQWIAMVRQRLQNLGWFMKCLKEPLSRLANSQDKTRGTFFEGRLKSVAIVDEEALLSWRDGIEKLRGERLLGRFFAASRDKLREIAQHHGVRHLVNLQGCPLR